MAFLCYLPGLLVLCCLTCSVKAPAALLGSEDSEPEVVSVRDTRETVEERLLTVDRNDNEVTTSENSTSVVEACPNIAVIQGPPGVPGIPGSHGIPGIPGMKGEDGECDCTGKVIQFSTKQCSWNDYNFAMNLGPIQSCTFNKVLSSTALKVEWHGSTRIKCLDQNPCCNRWYFTFDGSECRDPQPIEGLVYVDDGNATLNIHRHMSVVGLCMGLNQGLVDVGFAIGSCDGGYVRGYTRTGWNSASRIIIQEIPVN
ncbi:collagen triple helix repeat-containing protein 1-like isoform X1 [Ciona intestinalis]